MLSSQKIKAEIQGPKVVRRMAESAMKAVLAAEETAAGREEQAREQAQQMIAQAREQEIGRAHV